MYQGNERDPRKWQYLSVPVVDPLTGQTMGKAPTPAGNYAGRQGWMRPDDVNSNSPGRFLDDYRKQRFTEEHGALAKPETLELNRRISDGSGPFVNSALLDQLRKTIF